MEYFVPKIAKILSSCNDLKGPSPLKSLGSVIKLQNECNSTIPASFLGFKSVIIKNLCTFVNRMNYKEPRVKRVRFETDTLCEQCNYKLV